MSLLNPAWLQPVKMRAIVAHWTAGGHKPSDVDKEHYHFIVGGAGEIVKGDNDIADNVSTADNDYAAHTRGFNTGVIGVSVACMLGAVESPFNPGKYPMTKTQWDVLMKVIAELAKFYKISPTPTLILSHAEVQGTLGIQQRGKWDFTRLAFDPSVKGAKACGDKMRSEVAALLK
jgi:hypothetical protein